MIERPGHSRRVLITIGVYVASQVLLLLALGGWAYFDCATQGDGSRGVLGGCGVNFGLVALTIGWAQLVYGLVIVAIVWFRKFAAVTQGVLIGMAAVVLLFTALCFGSLFVGNG